MRAATKIFTPTARNVIDLSDNMMNVHSLSITLKNNTHPVLIDISHDNNNIKLTFFERITLADSGQSNFCIL